MLCKVLCLSMYNAAQRLSEPSHREGFRCSKFHMTLLCNPLYLHIPRNSTESQIMCSTKAQYTLSHGDEISASFSEAVDKALALYGQADDQTKQDFRTVRCKDWIRLDDWTTKPEKLLSSRILGEVWTGLKFWRAKPLLKWLDIYPLNADSHQ